MRNGWSCPCPRHENIQGVLVHSFLSSTLSGHKWSTSRPGIFTPGKEPATHWLILCFCYVAFYAEADILRGWNMSVTTPARTWPSRHTARHPYRWPFWHVFGHTRDGQVFLTDKMLCIEIVVTSFYLICCKTSFTRLTGLSRVNSSGLVFILRILPSVFILWQLYRFVTQNKGLIFKLVFYLCAYISGHLHLQMHCHWRNNYFGKQPMKRRGEMFVTSLSQCHNCRTAFFPFFLTQQ